MIKGPLCHCLKDNRIYITIIYIAIYIYRERERCQYFFMHVNLVFLIFEPWHSEAVMPAGRPGEGRNRSRLSNGDVQASMYDNEEDRFKDVSIDVKVLLTQYCCVILFYFNIPFLDLFTNIFPFNFHGYWYFFVILNSSENYEEGR